MSGNAGLSCKYGVFANGNTAGNSDLRYQDRIFTYSNIMSDMNQVIGLNALLNPGFAKCTPVDSVECTDFNIIIYLNMADVGKRITRFPTSAMFK